MRKALVVGIDHYPALGDLEGCVSGAHLVRAVLERHGDGSVNFDVVTLTGTAVTRSALREGVEELFADDVDVAVLYFAGRGHVSRGGGYLVTSDGEAGEDGLSLDTVLKLANVSSARNKIIILDCSHSGQPGNLDVSESALGLFAEGLTILTASTKNQFAADRGESGLFTALMIDALYGSAANLVGAITPGSIYAHIDQSLGSWGQRPLFKTNVKSFVSLRDVEPPVEMADLRRITEFFPTKGHLFDLDPTFEPERHGDQGETLPPPDPVKTQIFAILQKYNRVNLLVPHGAEHMWHAAIESKQCKLTVLGEHYRKLVANGRI